MEGVMISSPAAFAGAGCGAGVPGVVGTRPAAGAPGALGAPALLGTAMLSGLGLGSARGLLRAVGALVPAAAKSALVFSAIRRKACAMRLESVEEMGGGDG